MLKAITSSFSVFLLCIGFSLGQEKYSTEWYFDHVELTNIQHKDTEFIPAQFVKEKRYSEFIFISIREESDFDIIREANLAEKIRGISIRSSLKNFNPVRLEKALGSFPNLNLLQFYSSPLNRNPATTHTFPNYLSSYTNLKIISIQGDTEFSPEDFTQAIIGLPQIEGLFFFGFPEKISADLLRLPNLKALKTSVLSIDHVDFWQSLPIQFLEITNYKSYGPLNHLLEKVAQLPELNSLGIHYAHLAEKGYFRGFDKLEKLNFFFVDSLSNSQLFEEISHLTQLKKLGIFHMPQREQDLIISQPLPSLIHLRLSHIKALEDPSKLIFLNQLPTLERLELIK